MFAKKSDVSATGKKARLGLVNPRLRDVVEMAYWLIKFVGDYEKLSSKSYAKEVEPKKSEAGGGGEGLISANTRKLVAFSRYFLKYLGSFEKLFHKANIFKAR